MTCAAAGQWGHVTSINSIIDEFLILVCMASAMSPTNFTLLGKGLKLNTKDDIEPYFKDVDPTIIEEIHLGGNTIGVGAAERLGEFLEKMENLKVCSMLAKYRAKYSIIV